jgi:hypothetical protein
MLNFNEIINKIIEEILDKFPNLKWILGGVYKSKDLLKWFIDYIEKVHECNTIRSYVKDNFTDFKTMYNGSFGYVCNEILIGVIVMFIGMHKIGISIILVDNKGVVKDIHRSSTEGIDFTIIHSGHGFEYGGYKDSRKKFDFNKYEPDNTDLDGFKSFKLFLVEKCALELDDFDWMDDDMLLGVFGDQYMKFRTKTFSY